MKDLTEMANSYKPMQSKPNDVVIDEFAKSVVNQVFTQLAVIFPAWKHNWKTDKDLNLAKLEWTKAFNENGIRTVDQIKCGFRKARSSDSDFLPSCGKFISWCNDVDLTVINTAFDRMIKREPPTDNIEYNTRQDVSYQCKTQLDETRARKLFKDTYIKYQQMVARGEQIRDKDQLALPESSVVTEIDKEITEREGKPLTAIEKRMNKIRGK